MYLTTVNETRSAWVGEAHFFDLHVDRIEIKRRVSMVQLVRESIYNYV